MRALRQAVRHLARDRNDDRQAGRPFGVPGRRRRATEDVQRLPRDRYAYQPKRSPHHGSVDMATQSAAPLTFATVDGGEELARAELYGLLAQLWLAPPDTALL